MKTHTPYVSLILVGIFILGILFAATMIATAKSPVCLDEKTVIEIISLDYRNADIRLDDNSVITVNQAKLRKGDKFCVKWGK